MNNNHTPDPLDKNVEPRVDNHDATAPETTNAPARQEEQVIYHTPTDARVEEKKQVKSSFAGGTWVALIIGALLLIILLIFIMQNQQSVQLSFFTWEFAFPAGVGFLLAAIAGGLIMAMVGGIRMMQLRHQIKKGSSR